MTRWPFLATINPMLRSGFFLIALIIFSISKSAAHSQGIEIKQFESTSFSFHSEAAPNFMPGSGRYPESLQFIFQTVLGWTPRGEGPLLRPPCRSEELQQRMMDSQVAKNPERLGAIVQEYFQRCEGEVSTGVTNSWSNVAGMMSIEFSPEAHPFFHRVFVNLPGKIKLRGLLGLKGDRKRRPLVVLRLGIFSNTSDFKPERAWVMMLFEQSPFNILILENMTSSEFVANNEQFSFGGYEEALQNIFVAKKLTDSKEPLSQIVDSVHFFGVSLGGHGVLFSSLLNGLNSPEKKPLINSFIAMCPVVNLKETMTNLTSRGLPSAAVDMWSRQRLKELYTKMPDLQQHENFAFLSKAITEITKKFRGGLSYTQGIRLPTGLRNKSDFWIVNDFWKSYQRVEQPVLIFATRQDPLVPYELNAQKLKDKSQGGDLKNIQVVEFKHGVHCTLPIAYQWPVLAQVFQDFILSQSPKFKMTSRSQDLVFPEPISSVSFKVEEPDKNTGKVQLELSVVNHLGKLSSKKMVLDLAQLDFHFLNHELTKSERDMFVRWLNQNLKVEVINQKELSKIRVAWPVAL